MQPGDKRGCKLVVRADLSSGNRARSQSGQSAESTESAQPTLGAHRGRRFQNSAAELDELFVFASPKALPHAFPTATSFSERSQTRNRAMLLKIANRARAGRGGHPITVT